MSWGSNYIINNKFITMLLNSKACIFKAFKNCEKIYYNNSSNLIALIIKGNVEFNKYDDKNKLVSISKFSSGDILNFDFNDKSINIVSIDSSEIVFIDYNLLFDNNIIVDSNVKDIIFSIFQLLVNSNMKHTQRLIFLSNKTTEDKLLTFFKTNAIKDCCTLCISYTELANYLCVDRSSMMRTLSVMEKRGLIKRKGRRIIIIKKEDKISPNL